MSQERRGAQLLALQVQRLGIQLQQAALLPHAGEMGRARENALRDLVKGFLPPALSVTTGFVIDAQGGQSRQIDIIIHFADYHARFDIEGVPLVPVEAVIAVFEVKSDASSRSVLRAAYENLATVKRLDRSNCGRNKYLVDREPHELHSSTWDHFQFQVMGGVLARRSPSPDLWLDETQAWCRDSPSREWPNFYCGIDEFYGTYHAWRESVLVSTPNHMGAHELVLTRQVPGGESSLAWAVQEILNFVRVARRIDYSPSSYLYNGETPAAEVMTRPLR